MPLRVTDVHADVVFYLAKGLWSFSLAVVFLGAKAKKPVQSPTTTLHTSSLHTVAESREGETPEAARALKTADGPQRLHSPHNPLASLNIDHCLKPYALHMLSACFSLGGETSLQSIENRAILESNTFAPLARSTLLGMHVSFLQRCREPITRAIFAPLVASRVAEVPSAHESSVDDDTPLRTDNRSGRATGAARG